ncbi:rhodanese-like domain-containing protein [Candidatus Paracaedibacter symbiosus]|uniref:rhodanese-like domain-containing protein n=1 Tax=Candidatus Paracaedibacter symbiosus TaxID=244582 RepID=UPI000691F976|nr:rhodanese-like domain-containing protein [Candidatus Paracaedibacter symbiosus]
MVQEISPQDLQLMLSESQDYVLLDVRQPWEFKICHLPNSLNIPLNDLDKLTTQLPDDKEIVTICHHGVRSKQAAILLGQCGYPKAVSLQGGVDAWARDINPTMERY